MSFIKICSRCNKKVHCCIFNDGGFVFASPKNARAIRQKIKKDYSYFLDYSPLPKNVVLDLKHSDPCLESSLRYSQLDSKSRILRLKTAKDGRCIFLGADGLCKIYSIRPNVCRIFPFWAMRLTSGRIKIIEHDLTHRCGAIESLAKEGCDIEESFSAKKKAELKKVFKNIEKEACSYRKQIRKFAEILEFK